MNLGSDIVRWCIRVCSLVILGEGGLDGNRRE